MDKVETEHGRCFVESNIHKMMPSLEMVGTQDRLAKLTLYCTDVHLKSQKKDKQTFHRIHALDTPLCEMWKNILNPGYVISRVYTPTPPKPVRTVYVEKKDSGCVVM